MTIYEAPRLEPFAGSAPEDEIKTFEAWGRGLGIAFDETNGYPEMEGINGLFNTISKYILYLQQNGISEWKSGVVYPLGAGVRVGAKWYKAKRQNTNKTPQNSQDDWLNLFDALPEASTTQKGIVQLVDDLTIGGADKALTANIGRELALRDFGVGQTRKKSTLQLGTTYTNTSSKPWFVSVVVRSATIGKPAYLQLKVNGDLVALTQDVPTPVSGSNDIYVSHVVIEQIILPGETFIFENLGAGSLSYSSEIS